MSALQFTTAATEKAKERDEEETLIEFSIDDDEFVARMPTADSISLVMMEASPENGRAEQLRAVWAFLEDIILDDGVARMKRRVRDRNDELGMSKIMGEILPGLIQAFSGGFPTKPSTASSGSRASGGRSSTGRSPGRGSTRSTSRPAAS